MYRVILLSLGFVLAVSGNSIDMHKCGLFWKNMSCCNQELGLPIFPFEKLKECFEMHKTPLSCDIDICIGQKFGYASSDGTIDKKALTDMMEKDFKNPELTDRIKEECVYGDNSMYGPQDLCELMKIKLCLEVQVMKSCNKWKDDGECKGMKDIANEYIKRFN